MGLDITAYRGLTFVRAMRDEEDYGEPDHTTIYINNDFPGRADGLIDKGIYSFKDSFGFRAGSYSGYSVWRDKLAELAGYRPITVTSEQRPTAREAYAQLYRFAAGAWTRSSGPFYELIQFSDCEGTIGTEVARKLLGDFAEYETRIANAGLDKWFIEKYADWRHAFDLASDEGCVVFH